MAVYLIGIDGGGSKTDFILCDLALNEVARHFSGRSNPNDVPPDEAVAVVTDGVTALLRSARADASEVSACFAGIAGVTSGGFVSLFENALSRLLPNAAVGVLHDGINVLYGAFPNADGVSVICGTGSSCFVRKDGAIYRIGGYGALDLCGSGYEIGRAALAHALKAFDGREERGALYEAVCERYGNDPVGSLEKLLSLTKTEIASLAPAVFDCAKRGDGHARAIVNDNMEYIARMIECAGKFFDGDYPVALAGGIFREPLALETLAGMVPKRALLTINRASPVAGAAARAKQLLTEAE